MLAATCAALGTFGATPARAQPELKQGGALSQLLVTAPPIPKGAFGTLSIDATPERIVKRNLEAAAVLYSAAALEEMQLFAVADHLADKFVKGLLPLRGSAADKMNQWVRNRSDRLTEQERRSMYGHVFGGTQGNAASPNAEFASLWAQFLASASEYERQAPLAKAKKRASPEQVHQAARDLALNVSNRTYGASLFAAATLARHIRTAVQLLSDPAVLGAFGARDMWQLVEQVSKKELGKTANTVRQRTIAESGASILNWLGQVSQPLGTSGGAAAVADSMTAARVPGAVRRLNRVLTSKQKLIRAEAKKTATQVRALCFDKKRRLVACQVKLKK